MYTNVVTEIARRRSHVRRRCHLPHRCKKRSNSNKLECGPMPNVMAALPNIGGALCSTPQSLADATTRMPCSNAAKMRNPLKFARVSQTPEPISAVSGPKFTILRRHVEEVLLNKFFFRLSIHASVAKIQPDKVVRWCRYGDFLRHFCALYFQRQSCSAINCLSSGINMLAGG